MANYLDSQYTQLFFSLLLQHNNFAHLLPLFGIVVFPMKGVRNPFMHKIVMLAVHVWNSTANTFTVTIYDCTKTVDDQFIKV